MTALPQTFRPARGVVVEAFVAMAIGALLLGLFLIPLGTGIRNPAVLIAAVPGLLFIGKGVAAYLNAAPKTIDEDGVWIDGPLGPRGARWGDVVGYDVLGTEAKGVRLLLRDGRRVAISYYGHADDGLYDTVHGRLAELSPFGVEGRVFHQQGRWPTALGAAAILAFFAIAAAVGSPNPLRTFWVPLAMLGPVFVPLTLWGVTDYAVLKDGVLTKGSIFGTTRLGLADVTEAEFKTVRRRHSGTIEKLVLTGREDDVTLEPGYDGYAVLRDAVIAELRPSVRPRLPGEASSPRSVSPLRTESARPQRTVEGHVFWNQALGAIAFVFVLLALFFGFTLSIGGKSRPPILILQGLQLLLFASVLPSVAEYAVLRGETLTVFSRLRRRQIPLARVRRAEFRTVTRGSVRRECLFLMTPGGEVELPSRLREGDRLIDAVLRALPAAAVSQAPSRSA